MQWSGMELEWSGMGMEMEMGMEWHSMHFLARTGPHWNLPAGLADA